MQTFQLHQYRSTSHLIRAIFALLVMAATVLAGPLRDKDKITAEEVIAQHLAALGSEKARTHNKTYVVAGTARALFKAQGGTGNLDGRAVLASEGNKTLLGMSFPAINYPGEKFGFDGNNFTVGYLNPGVRSTLGSFLLIHGNIFKEGLVGGTLSSAWPLLDLASRKAKVSYAGSEKVNGQLAYKLGYRPNKGSDLDITLFFDAKTFRHIKTEYERVAGARLGVGGIDNQASQRALRYKMTETFSEYQKEGELILPHSYQLQLEIENTKGSSSHRWEMKLSQFVFNQEIDAHSFNVEAK